MSELSPNISLDFFLGSRVQFFHNLLSSSGPDSFYFVLSTGGIDNLHIERGL